MDQEVIDRTGFYPCNYPPSDDDCCEKCSAANVQLYGARMGYWEQEYDTWCESCILEWDAELRCEEANPPAEAGT